MRLRVQAWQCVLLHSVAQGSGVTMGAAVDVAQGSGVVMGAAVDVAWGSGVMMCAAVDVGPGSGVVLGAAARLLQGLGLTEGAAAWSGGKGNKGPFREEEARPGIGLNLGPWTGRA